MTDSFDFTRRRFLQLGLTVLAGSVAMPAEALTLQPKSKPRSLAFHNLHTDERLRVTYWENGVYSRSGLARVNSILRDYRTGAIRSMNPRLMDLLHDLQLGLGHDGAVEIISGYRSPGTNAMLAKVSGGVANHSYHTKGMAIDIRLSGVSLARVHKKALAMNRGGVGYYPSSDFVHVDVGPVRRW